MPEHDDQPLTGPEHLDDTVAKIADTLAVGTPDPSESNVFSLEEMLESARLPEDFARIVLRADLEAEHSRLVGELAALINTDGTLADDDEEASVGDVSAAGRAQAKAAELAEVKRAMADSVRYIRVRGLSDEDLRTFQKANELKAKNPTQEQLDAFNNKLVAAVAIEPELTVEQVRQMRQKLGKASIGELVAKANKVCLRGGVDVPKSPVSLVNLAGQ